jgi:hypothetical protein
MQSILDLIHASFAPVNLPLTLLLLFVVFYWILVLSGFLGFDLGGSEADSALVSDSSGPLQSVTHFLRVGEAPITAILSVLILCLWTFSILANHHFNPDGSLLLGLGLFIPNLVLAAIVTRILTKPVRKLFQVLNKDYDRHEDLVGQVCVITTLEANQSFGQALIETKGAPLSIHVRLSAGVLHRGDRALIIGENKDKHTFQIVKYQEPQLES